MPTRGPLPGRLSARQRRVLELSATGATVAEVATRLDLTDGEVRACLSSILDALGAGSKLEALLLALRAGLIEGPSR